MFFCFDLICLIKSTSGEANIQVVTCDHIQNPNLVFDSTLPLIWIFVPSEKASLLNMTWLGNRTYESKETFIKLSMMGH